jgi:hypothetical protein
MSSPTGSNYVRDELNKKFKLNITTYDEMDAALYALNIDIIWEINYIIYRTYAPDFNDTLRQSFGYDASTMFSNALFYSYPINISENFQRYYSPRYGNCYKVR